MKNRALHELFSQREHRAQVKLLGSLGDAQAIALLDWLGVPKRTWSTQTVFADGTILSPWSLWLFHPKGKRRQNALINLSIFATWHFSTNISTEMQRYYYLCLSEIFELPLVHIEEATAVSVLAFYLLWAQDFLNVWIVV